MTSDKEILEVFEGNANAGLNLLHRKYSNVCYAVAMRYMQNSEDAEECVIDTYLAAFKHLHKFEYTNEGLLRNWLKKVCINNCLQYLRRRKRMHFVELAELQIASTELPSDGLCYTDIIRLMDKLPEAQRIVFQLYEIDGFSHVEIGQQLSMSVGTSKSYLHRAKSSLKNYLTQENYTNE